MEERLKLLKKMVHSHLENQQIHIVVGSGAYMHGNGCGRVQEGQHCNEFKI